MTEFLTGSSALARTIYNANVWTILVEECDSNKDGFLSFDGTWPACGEYRFMGNQGFGGKVWAPSRYGPAYVTCYIEDENPIRDAARKNANTRLAALTNM